MLDNKEYIPKEDLLEIICSDDRGVDWKKIPKESIATVIEPDSLKISGIFRLVFDYDINPVPEGISLDGFEITYEVCWHPLHELGVARDIWISSNNDFRFLKKVGVKKGVAYAHIESICEKYSVEFSKEGRFFFSAPMPDRESIEGCMNNIKLAAAELNQYVPEKNDYI